MKKSIWIFLLAVFLPSVVLGWLALRSAEEQQIILEKRTAELYQKETENAAGAVRALIDSERRSFGEAVGRVVATGNPHAASLDFSAKLAKAWPRKAVGFAIGKDGRLISPTSQSARSNAEIQKFLLENSAFLCSTMPATVYWVSGDELSRPDLLRRKNSYDGLNFKNIGESQGVQVAQSKMYSKGETTIDVPGNAPRDLEGRMRDTSKAINSTTSGVPQGGAAPAAPEPLAPFTAQAAAAPMSPAAAVAPAVAAAVPAPVPASIAAPAASAPAPDLRDAKIALTENEVIASPETKSASDSAVLAIRGATATKPRSMPQRKSAPKAIASEDKSPVSVLAGADLKKDQRAAPAEAPAIPLGKVQISPGPSQVMDELQQKQGESLSQNEVTQGQTLTLSAPNMVRNVAPQRMPEGDNNAVLSQLTPSTVDFRALTSDGRDGVITRFVQDQLDIIFWLRPAQDPDMIFGCLIESDNLADVWPQALPSPELSSIQRISGHGGAEFALALLDDRARPVATQPPGEKGRDWKRPFVASEIGEALPHWEAALYLQRPEQLRESAIALRRTLIFLVAAALGAIACGGWVVVADARRQLALAQQKTDFVSNVSHELKTPLTSIRMFAELMQGGRPETAAKYPQYLRIIMVEAERLTRLINNVLDFARIERKQKRFDKKPVELHSVIERTWEGHELHLRESGFVTRWQAAPPPYPVVGDEDALAQILVNLLSNAEKYSGDRKEVDLHTYIDDGRICVSVLDRGMGVPPGEERKIFEAFYRAHDSLSSGIQGSGLGLTLAQRLAREHGGEILYQAREGGGSNFTLRIPVSPQTSSENVSL